MATDTPITPELVLKAYASGCFPMAKSRKGKVLQWYFPETRGALSLKEDSTFHVPRSLKKFAKKHLYRITIDQDFMRIITACADIPRDGCWINDEIIALYAELARQGHAHSIECWEGRELVGGLYGVSLGGAFFGESMFSTRPNASKIALLHLVSRLKKAGYTLLDAQFENPHLEQFGFQAMPAKDYMTRLERALMVSPNPSNRFAMVSVPSPITSGA